MNILVWLVIALILSIFLVNRQEGFVTINQVLNATDQDDPYSNYKFNNQVDVMLDKDIEHNKAVDVYNATSAQAAMADGEIASAQKKMIDYVTNMNQHEFGDIKTFLDSKKQGQRWTVSTDYDTNNNQFNDLVFYITREKIPFYNQTGKYYTEYQTALSAKNAAKAGTTQYTTAVNNLNLAQDLWDWQEFLDSTMYQAGRTILQYRTLYLQYVNQLWIKSRISEQLKQNEPPVSDTRYTFSQAANTLNAYYNAAIKANVDKAVDQKSKEFNQTFDDYKRNAEKTLASAVSDATSSLQTKLDLMTSKDDEMNTAIETSQRLPNAFLINDIARTTAAKLDRYADPSCNENEYLYCVGGDIVCEDVFGNELTDVMQPLDGTPGVFSGTTFGKCGSHLNKLTLDQSYASSNSFKLYKPVAGNHGYFYDRTACPRETDPQKKDKPLRVGGEGTPIDFDGCYEDDTAASARFQYLRLNAPDKSNDLLVGSAIYLSLDNLLNVYANGNTYVAQFVQKQPSLWIDNAAYIKGVIFQRTTKNWYDVKVPDLSGAIMSNMNPEFIKVLTLDTNNTGNKTQLKKGDLPRPKCKGGEFTTKCYTNSPFTPGTGTLNIIDPDMFTPKSTNDTAETVEKYPYLMTSNTMSDSCAGGTSSLGSTTLPFSLY